MASRTSGRGSRSSRASRKIVTDGLRAYPAAMREVGNADRRQVGRGLNNRAENSHQPFRRRERTMQRFRSMKTLQKFSSVQAQVHNHFNHERHLITRQVYKQRRSATWSSGAPSRLECRLDGNSALILAEARLKHIASTCWSTKCNLNMDLLRQRTLTVQGGVVTSTVFTGQYLPLGRSRFQ